MLDVISIGSCIAELTPARPGQPLIEGGPLEVFPSGASANFAFAAARLGLKAALVSRVGEDELGKFIITRLERGGVDVSHIFSTPGQLTTISLCWADGRGKKFFYHYRLPGLSEPLCELASADLEDEFLANSRLLHFSEACVREAKLRRAVFEIADRFRALGGSVLYCPNYRGVWREGEAEMRAAQRQTAGLADYLVLNEEEAEIITREPAERAAGVLREWGPSAVVITCGEKGARLFSREENCFIPAYEVPVVYDVGAGDTFQAGFAAGLSWGMGLAESVRFAAAAAALRITRSGDPALLPTARGVRDFMAEKSCKEVGAQE
jgi:sugar/nucleoside kinase (ribokinase family)